MRPRKLNLMDWNKLLSTRRLGRDEPYDTRGRSAYQRDHDRIVFCSAFRRMQDKTQVFPLAHVDYVRTRLTHSLEVSCVGRSLGVAVAADLIERYQLKDVISSDLGALVAAACLAHDIGNPPFGHSGEQAIQHWFKHTRNGKNIIESLEPVQAEDFLKFEGNAQALRALTKLQHPNNKGGLQLTCATLAAMCKYPRPALWKKNPTVGISGKKPGYFQSEEEIFRQVAKEVGLHKRPDDSYSRHPLAFLVEAADDICYHFVDFGDGFRLGHITYEEAYELLLNVLDDQREDVRQRIMQFEEPKERIEYLVGKAISELIAQVSHRFIQVEPLIISGEFDQELISQVKSSPYLEKIKELSIQKVYGAHEVIEVEAAGYEVLGGLLEFLVEAVEDTALRRDDTSARSKKLLQLIPGQFLGPGRRVSQDRYTRVQKITDFIAGMTDSYAMTFYRKLTGIQFMGGIR